MENPIKMDDLGVPLFSETLTYWKQNFQGSSRSSFDVALQVKKKKALAKSIMLVVYLIS